MSLFHLPLLSLIGGGVVLFVSKSQNWVLMAKTDHDGPEIPDIGITTKLGDDNKILNVLDPNHWIITEDATS